MSFRSEAQLFVLPAFLRSSSECRRFSFGRVPALTARMREPCVPGANGATGNNELMFHFAIMLNGYSRKFLRSSGNIARREGLSSRAKERTASERREP